MSVYFTIRLTPLTHLGLLALPSRRDFPGRTARGSAALRKMACPLARGATFSSSGSRPSTRAQGRGSPVAAPSNRERKMEPTAGSHLGYRSLHRVAPASVRRPPSAGNPSRRWLSNCFDDTENKGSKSEPEGGRNRNGDEDVVAMPSKRPHLTADGHTEPQDCSAHDK